MFELSWSTKSKINSGKVLYVQTGNNSVSFSNKTRILKLPLKTDLAALFKNLVSLEYIEFSQYDFSVVENIARLFDGCSNLKKVNFGDNKNFSSLKYSILAFANCSNLTEIQIHPEANFNSLSNTYMMFSDSGLESFTIQDSMKIPNLEIIDCMFMNCEHLKEVNIGKNVNLTKIESLSSVFYNCSALKNITLSKNIIMKPERMISTFEKCQSLEELDLTCIHGDNLKNMVNTFRNCWSLKILKLKNINIENRSILTNHGSELNTTFINTPEELKVYCTDKLAKQFVNQSLL